MTPYTVMSSDRVMINRGSRSNHQTAVICAPLPYVPSEYLTIPPLESI